MLYYRNVASIDRGTWANYNDDRIVFYENDYTGRDFAAFVRNSLFTIPKTLH